MIRLFKKLFRTSSEVIVIDRKGLEGEPLVDVQIRRSGIFTELKNLSDTETSALMMAIRSKRDATGDVSGEISMIEAIQILDDISYGYGAGIDPAQVTLKLEN